MASGSAVEKFLSGVQRRIIAGPRYDYILLVVLAVLPWCVAWVDGALFDTAPLATVQSHPPVSGRTSSEKVFTPYACVSVGSTCVAVQSTKCAGYIHRKNWTWLVFELPLALLALRYTASQLFLADRQGEERPGREAKIQVIPDLIQPPSLENTRAKLLDAATKWENVVIALGLDIVLHGFDLQDTISVYAHALLALCPKLQFLRVLPHGYIKMQVSMPEWDWASYFLAMPSKRSLFGNLLLVLVAYPCQFLMVLFAMSLLVLLYRHNRYFLSSIYVRSRPTKSAPEDFIVLNFDDPDRRMGLGPLAARFNAQMIVLLVAGALTLASRFANANRDPVKRFIANIAWGDFVNPPKVLLAPPYSLGDLFPDAGQKLFALMWLVMFIIVMMPAWAKCLPLWYAGMKEPGVVAFLREFVPASRWTDKDRTDAEVTALAQSFACQSFWPVGDAWAQALSILCFFMFAIILVPIFPASRKEILYLGEVLVVSYTISQSLFWIFGYILSIVDKRLISKS